MKTPLIVTALALLPLAGFAGVGDQTKPATSAPTATSQSGSFDALDTNKDGRISMPEASADPKLVEGFSTADKNGDGYLDNAEYHGSTTPQK